MFNLWFCADVSCCCLWCTCSFKNIFRSGALGKKGWGKNRVGLDGFKPGFCFSLVTAKAQRGWTCNSSPNPDLLHCANAANQGEGPSTQTILEWNKAMLKGISISVVLSFHSSLFSCLFHFFSLQGAVKWMVQLVDCALAMSWDTLCFEQVCAILSLVWWRSCRECPLRECHD